MNLSAKQKRVLGILLFTFFGLLIFMLVFGSIYLLVARKDNSGALSLAFMIFLFYLPVHYGIRLYKQGKSESLVLKSSIIQEETIVVPVKINLPEYRSLILQLTYTNLFIIYITGLGIMSAFYLIFNPPTELSFGLILPIMVLIIPISAYYQAEKAYKSTKNLKEDMTYNINSKDISIKGETFHSTTTWESLHKVKETNKWFLLYTNNVAAFLIPKQSFASAANLELFKNFIIKTPGILKELR